MRPGVAGRAGMLTVLGLLILASCVAPSTEPSSKTTAPPPTTTVSSIAAAFEWPVVKAGNFIHRPRGAVRGVPVSFPDPMWCGCSVVTLDDGRVLMVGSGYGIGYAAWIWDPATRKWSVTGAPVSVWGGFDPLPGVLLLDDGRVLATFYNNLEIYDPAAGSFQRLDYPVHYGAAATLKGDGRVFLATGSRSGVVFDPDSEGFAVTGSAGEPELGVIAAVALEDGRVLIVNHLAVSVYDPATGSFDLLNPLYPPEEGVAVAQLLDGRVIFTGGESWSYESLTPLDLGSAEVQIFDPTTDSFVAAHSMLEPRSHHSAVTMSDGRVAIVGGAEGRVELFDPNTGVFTQAPELSRPRQSPAVTTLDDGSLLVVGGRDAGAASPGGQYLDNTTMRTAEIYKPDLASPAEPSEEILSGLTLSLEPDIDWSVTSERSTGSQWLELDVPPGGLQRVAYVQAVWEFKGPYPGKSRINWEGADTRIWGWGVDVERQLPTTCHEECVIREEMFDSRWATSFTGVYLHIQYEGEIPVEASEITLTIVDKR
jgi:hypothetical protein